VKYKLKKIDENCSNCVSHLCIKLNIITFIPVMMCKPCRVLEGAVSVPVFTELAPCREATYVPRSSTQSRVTRQQCSHQQEKGQKTLIWMLITEPGLLRTLVCFGLLGCGAGRRLMGGKTPGDVLATVPSRAAPVKLSWGSGQPGRCPQLLGGPL